MRSQRIHCHAVVPSCYFSWWRAFFLFVLCLSAAGEVYSVIPDHPVIQPSNRYDIENYFEHNVGTGEFKVLVVESRSRLAFWAVRRHYKSAAGAAKKDCQDYTQSFNCQIFAVGGTIVWDMSSREREQTINDYGAGKLQEEDEENKTYVKGIRMEIFRKKLLEF